MVLSVFPSCPPSRVLPSNLALPCPSSPPLLCPAASTATPAAARCTSSHRASTSSVLRRAKFERFSAADPSEEDGDAVNEAERGEDRQQIEEDDSCLPPDLEGAIRQSAVASADFVSAGGMRAIVELLIPQLEFLNTEGAQAEVWELSRLFLETLVTETKQKVKAIYPDAGAAALLKYQWKDANFKFSSLSDRIPVDDEDEVVVMIIPDHQMLEYVERIASHLSDYPRPLVMWNPRLVSGDVGVGFNVRNLRRNFLSSFTTVYFMRPLPTGAIFRCYPGLWKVFFDDTNRPNRYLLAREQLDRPDSTDIEVIFGQVSDKKDAEPSFLNQAMGIFNSMNRFMKAISK